MGWHYLYWPNHHHLKTIKTDPFCRGHQVQIFPTNSSNCPVQVLKLHIPYANYTSSGDPLFNGGRFSPLSQASLNRALRHLLTQIGFNQSSFASHSFRIGAAITPAAAGIPSWIIKSQGRWSSNAYLSYVHCMPTLTPAVLELMSKTDATHQPPWEAVYPPYKTHHCSMFILYSSMIMYTIHPLYVHTVCPPATGRHLLCVTFVH